VRAVADTSVLIALGRMGYLGLLPRLFDDVLLAAAMEEVWVRDDKWFWRIWCRAKKGVGIERSSKSVRNVIKPCFNLSEWWLCLNQ